MHGRTNYQRARKRRGSFKFLRNLAYESGTEKQDEMTLSVGRSNTVSCNGTTFNMLNSGLMGHWLCTLIEAHWLCRCRSSWSLSWASLPRMVSLTWCSLRPPTPLTSWSPPGTTVSVSTMWRRTPCRLVRLYTNYPPTLCV